MPHHYRGAIDKRCPIYSRGLNKDGLEADTINIIPANDPATGQLIIKWLTEHNPNKEDIEFVSDVCHYDMTLLISILWGSALNIKEPFVPVCYDINQDIMKHFGVSQKEAFNMSREDIVSKYNPTLASKDDWKHNALYDALVIKTIYESISK